MFHALKKIGCAVLLAGLAQSAFGYALLGPNGIEPWQLPAIGYQIGGDIGTPRNINEEYRWNTPVVYYAFDNNFLTYFGSNGVTAVEQAIAVINSLTNYSAMSPDLSEFPLESQRVNYEAQALSLLDLKSEVLHLLIEELGLAEPSRWVWTLRDRQPQPGLSCPFMFYGVIQRNWDPVFTNEPVNSSYINGTLYDYLIVETCNGTTPTAFTDNFPPDPVANTPSAVADISANYGYYNTGLTRDDVGGLRYLMGTNNINFEAVSSDSQQLFTNTTTQQLLVTSNLAVFLQQAATNNAATLTTLYPGLIITATTNYFTNAVTTNVTATFVHPVNAPAGTFTVQFVTNFTTNVVTLFSHTFANVVTNHYYTNGFVTTSVTNVVAPPNSPVGYVQTNVVDTTVFTQFVNGDFYLIPSNALCSSSGYQILSTQLVQVLTVTNTFGTNSTTSSGGITNNQPTPFNIITYFTNYSLVVFPIQCIDGSNSISLREGIDKITFVRASYDSLIGQHFTPITNNYTLTAITNSSLQSQSFQRILRVPDFLFSAEDRGNGSDGVAYSLGFRSVPNWNTNGIPGNNGGAAYGPGIMQPPVLIELNKVGVVIRNIYDPFNSFFSGLSQADGITNYVWGSFDGTTNAPIIYPDGSSLNDLENQILLQVLTSSLPDATVGAPYSTQLQGSGGQLPYVWSLDTNSPALPPGLSISAAGIISGTPSTAGIYDFTVAFTEAGARMTSRPLSITVN